jgi:hypothetical protein
VAAVTIDIAQGVGVRRSDFAKGRKFIGSPKELDRLFKSDQMRF